MQWGLVVIVGGCARGCARRGCELVRQRKVVTDLWLAPRRSVQNRRVGSSGQHAARQGMAHTGKIDLKNKKKKPHAVITEL